MNEQDRNIALGKTSAFQGQRQTERKAQAYDALVERLRELSLQPTNYFADSPQYQWVEYGLRYKGFDKLCAELFDDAEGLDWLQEETEK